jgi:hypothetical protein
VPLRHRLRCRLEDMPAMPACPFPFAGAAGLRRRLGGADQKRPGFAGAAG